MPLWIVAFVVALGMGLLVHGLWGGLEPGDVLQSLVVAGGVGVGAWWAVRRGLGART